LDKHEKEEDFYVICESQREILSVGELSQAFEVSKSNELDSFKTLPAEHAVAQQRHGRNDSEYEGQDECRSDKEHYPRFLIRMDRTFFQCIPSLFRL